MAACVIALEQEPYEWFADYFWSVARDWMRLLFMIAGSIVAVAAAAALLRRRRFATTPAVLLLREQLICGWTCLACAAGLFLSAPFSDRLRLLGYGHDASLLGLHSGTLIPNALVALFTIIGCSAWVFAVLGLLARCFTRLPRPGECVGCGYDRSGITGSCPECGAAPGATGRESRRFLWWPHRGVRSWVWWLLTLLAAVLPPLAIFAAPNYATQAPRRYAAFVAGTGLTWLWIASLAAAVLLSLTHSLRIRSPVPARMAQLRSGRIVQLVLVVSSLAWLAALPLDGVYGVERVQQIVRSGRLFEEILRSHPIALLALGLDACLAGLVVLRLVTRTGDE